MNKKIIITAVVVLIIISGACFYLRSYWLESLIYSPWYAVHLSNGQVYFGHIANVRNGTISMKNVHYLEAFQSQDSSSGNGFTVETSPKQVYKLITRGEDKNLATDHNLFVNRQSVLFWEKLDKNSEIAKLINSKKAETGKQ